MKLNKLGVLVTRPAHQAKPLCDLIEQAGGVPFLFPTLEINDIADTAALQSVVDGFYDVDIVLFVSVNAVLKVAPFIKDAFPSWPEGVLLGAIGHVTAETLRGEGWPVHIFPDQRFDSEGLLEQPLLQDIQDKKIVIFSGEGGREYLQQTLIERGAKVSKVPVYVRDCPKADIAPIIRFWQEERIQVVLATSSEGLANLCQLLGDEGMIYLQKTPLVVMSQRIADSALALGYSGVLLIAANASDQGILTVLEQEFGI